MIESRKLWHGCSAVFVLLPMFTFLLLIYRKAQCLLKLFSVFILHSQNTFFFFLDERINKENSRSFAFSFLNQFSAHLLLMFYSSFHYFKNRSRALLTSGHWALWTVALWPGKFQTTRRGQVSLLSLYFASLSLPLYESSSIWISFLFKTIAAFHFRSSFEYKDSVCGLCLNNVAIYIQHIDHWSLHYSQIPVMLESVLHICLIAFISYQFYMEISTYL